MHSNVVLYAHSLCYVPVKVEGHEGTSLLFRALSLYPRSPAMQMRIIIGLAIAIIIVIIVVSIVKATHH